MSINKKIGFCFRSIGCLAVINLSNTYLGRYIRWSFPDVYDLTKFPSVPIQHEGVGSVWPQVVERVR